MGLRDIRPFFFIQIVLFSGVYLLASWAGLFVTIVGPNVTPIWAPSGVAIAVVLLLGRQFLIVPFLASLLSSLHRENSIFVSLLFALAAMVEAALPSIMLERDGNFRTSLERLRDVLLFIFWAGVVAPFVSAFVGVLALYLEGAVVISLVGRAIFTWWIGDAIGALIVGALILTWAGGGRLLTRQRHLYSFSLLFLGLAAVNLFLFARPITERMDFSPLSYSVFPFIIWAALQFGPRAATLSVFITAAVSVWGASRGYGPFVVEGHSFAGILLLMAFLSIHSVTALILAAVSAERKRSDVKMRAITESFPIGLFFANPAGRCTYINDKLGEISGLTFDEAVGDGWSAILHPEDRLRVLTQWAEHVHSRSYFHVFFRIMKRGGGLRWVVMRSSPIMDSDQLSGFVGTVADITDARVAEEALHESQAKLTAAIENLPFEFWMTDSSGSIILQNSTCLRTWGDLIGYSPDTSPLSPELNEVWRANNKAALSGNILRQDFSFRTDEGERLYHSIVSPVRFEEEIRGVSGISLDLTDQKRVVEAFEESERQRLMLLSAVPGMAYRCRKDERYSFEFVSEGCRTITGYEPAQLVSPEGIAFADLVHPEDLPRIIERCTSCLERRVPLQEEYRILNAKGEVRWIWEYARGVYNGDGEPVAIEGFAMDITDRRHLEEGLLQAQKLDSIGRLAGGIAHDFNNLLTTILGYVELAMKDFSRMDPRRKRIENISDAAHRAAALTRQLLAFARKQVIKPREVNLNELVVELSRMIRRVIGEDIRLEIDTAVDLAAVRIDPSQIDQVLLNLCINARDAMPDGGTVTISTSNRSISGQVATESGSLLEGEYVALMVTDTGIGIPPEDIPHIFEPFFTTKGPDKGTGLGLATCYGIVKQSDGHILVESEPGAGTTFTILFPATRNLNVPVERTREVEVQLWGDERILLVEDEPEVRKVAEQCLSERGFKVVTAVSGRDALDKAQLLGAVIDLVITDVVMPQMGGRELVDNLHALGIDAPVIFMSGYAENALTFRGIELDQVDFLQKPFTPSTLLRKVREVLRDVGKGLSLQ